MHGINLFEPGGKRISMWIDHREIAAISVHKNLLNIEVRFKSNPTPLFIGCADEDELHRIARLISELLKQ